MSSYGTINYLKVGVVFSGPPWRSLADRDVTLLLQAGLKSIDLTFYWSDPNTGEGVIEVDIGVFDFSAYGVFVNKALENGMEVIGRLAYGHPLYGSPNPYAPPADLNDYGNFVYETVKHFAGKVIYWIIWNEPNVPKFWGGVGSGPGGSATPAEYAELLKVAYQQAKKANPNAIISAASISRADPESAKWLQGLYHAKAKDFFEVVSVNPYSFPAPPEYPYENDPKFQQAFWRVEADMRQVMINNGDASKPIWITEFGYPMADQGPRYPDVPVWESTVSESVGADYLVRAIKLAQTWSWCERLHIFRWTDVREYDPTVGQSGLLRRDWTPKLAYNAVKDFLASNNA